MDDSSRDTERDRVGKGKHVTAGNELEDARRDDGESECGCQDISETEMGDEGTDDESCNVKRWDISDMGMGDEGADDKSCAAKR